MPHTDHVPPDHHENHRKRRSLIPLILLAVLLVLGAFAWFSEIEYAYIPNKKEVLNPGRINQDLVYELWGQSFTQADLDRLRTEDPELLARLTPAHGAVKVDPEVLEMGREAFYSETWGNEEFATEILGMFNGPLSRWEFAKAVLRARGEGTNNLQVRTSRAATIGGRDIPKGTMISTGLDVPKGAWGVMGMNPGSGRVIEGAPNLNINIGKLIALSTNSASLFVNAELGDLDQYLSESSLTITTSDGKEARLPDPAVLEDAVDRVFMSWPPGFFAVSMSRR
jgi:hypothetical protein